MVKRYRHYFKSEAGRTENFCFDHLSGYAAVQRNPADSSWDERI